MKSECFMIMVLNIYHNIQCLVRLCILCSSRDGIKLANVPAQPKVQALIRTLDASTLV